VGERGGKKGGNIRNEFQPTPTHFSFFCIFSISTDLGEGERGESIREGGGG